MILFSYLLVYLVVLSLLAFWVVIADMYFAPNAVLRIFKWVFHFYLFYSALVYHDLPYMSILFCTRCYCFLWRAISLWSCTDRRTFASSSKCPYYFVSDCWFAFWCAAYPLSWKVVAFLFILKTVLITEEIIWLLRTCLTMNDYGVNMSHCLLCAGGFA